MMTAELATKKIVFVASSAVGFSAGGGAQPDLNPDHPVWQEKFADEVGSESLAEYDRTCHTLWRHDARPRCCLFSISHTSSHRPYQISQRASEGRGSLLAVETGCMRREAIYNNNELKHVRT